jgi:hypothetical protein
MQGQREPPEHITKGGTGFPILVSIGNLKVHTKPKIEKWWNSLQGRYRAFTFQQIL